MLYIAVLLIVAGLISAAPIADPQCNTSGYQIIPKADCKGYYLCVFGRPVEMPPCPTRSKFSASVNVCVPEGSVFDDCKSEGGLPVTDGLPIIPDAGPLSIEERCNMFGGIIAHPTECQAYYNCSVRYQNVPRLLEQHLVECSYPELFHAETKQCEHFENVKCGSRREFKDACDYRRNGCVAAHCIPCNVQFGKCEGKPNGLAPHEAKLWSPYYVVCYKDRTVEHNTCKADESGRTQLFHPDFNQCVPLDMIPRDHGGMMPECETKLDGLYPDVSGRCDRYVHCKGGKYAGTVKCAVGEVFDFTRAACMPEHQACGPRGKHENC
ncbi:hypothetical protein DPMN_122060 [Dreissena polymorpha]|uniref:Chitin-binding type-2 domain-containing protein n=1 Tax=Dreissena polymorpha TaxID=45954 RepID=A0A9D4GNA7_DREPO|nr:hypothetical protein DPMN_122060 [Dreissena polymorpha]